MDKLTGKGEEIVENVEEWNRIYVIKIFSKVSQAIAPNHFATLIMAVEENFASLCLTISQLPI